MHGYNTAFQYIIFAIPQYIPVCCQCSDLSDVGNSNPSSRQISSPTTSS
jgi:hypothetical protein